MHSIKRNSSIELLRILSMLIIVIYHYEARNFNLYVVASDRVGEPDLLPQLLTHSIGKLGVPVFVFISGWYGLKYRKERFWEMVGMCIFYALISCIGCQLLYGQVRFLELPFSINLWWFMAAYLSIVSRNQSFYRYMRQMASFIGCSDNYLYIIWRLFCKVCQYRRTIPNVQHVPKCKVDKIISKKMD